MLFALLAAIATAYQLVAIAACLRFTRQKRVQREDSPAISILKPIRGLDPGFYAAIDSHASQDYPEFEILFGVTDANDPAVAEITRLKTAHRETSIHTVHAKTAKANRKVGVLMDLAAEARHDIYLVNDSDIRVPAGYLRDVVAPLADRNVGLVTCLYRATADRLPGKMEALGIATDFAPSTLVAPLVGVDEFGLGSTLCFRKEDLIAIGGFESIADYLADDYQLAKRITTGLKKRAHLSHVIVDTSLQAETWGEVWRHQVRWHRTIRVSRPGGYLGLPITNATIWAIAAFWAGHPWFAAAALASRMVMALEAGNVTLHCPITRRYWWCVPARDLFGFAVWIAGLFGNRVRWRDRDLRLTRDGRIEAE